MTDTLLHAQSVLGDQIHFETEQLGPWQAARAQLEVGEAYPLVMRHRGDFRATGASLFEGRSAPCKPTSIEEILKLLNSGQGIPVDESWQELWLLPAIQMPEVLRVLPLLDFPSQLKKGCLRTPAEVLKLSVDFAQEIHEKAPLDLIMVKPTLVLFAFSTIQAPELSLDVARKALRFSRQFFNTGPSPSYTARAWAEEGMFGIGSA